MEHFQLGNWQVFPKLNQLTLTTDEKKVTITPKLMQLLLTLANNRTTPLSVEQLINSVWSGRIVADSSVYQAIAQLRKVLGQDNTYDVYIERISGQGYRIAPAITVSEVKTEPLNYSPQELESSTESNKSNSIEVVSNHSVSKQAEHQPRKTITFTALALLVATFIYFAWLKDSDKHASAVEDPFFEQLSLASHLINQSNAGKIEQAKQLYLEVLKQDSENVDALRGLCASYRLLSIYGTLTELERDSLCQPLLEKALELAPDNPQVLASMAKQSFEFGKTNEAEKLFAQALNITHGDASIWHWFGQLKRMQNQIDAALKAHQAAFKLAPNDPKILRGLAYAHLNNRDLTSARKYFERSVLIAPNVRNNPLYALDFYPLTQERAENFLQWRDKYQESYSKKNPLHRLSYVILLLSLNQTELAQQEFDAVIGFDNENHHFLLYTQAALAWHKGQQTKALALLKQRYHIAPEKNHYVVPYLIALLHTNNAKQALSIFKQHFPHLVSLEQVTDQDLGQYLLLAALYKKNGETKQYEQALEKLLSYKNDIEQFPIQQEIFWAALNEDATTVYQQLEQLLVSGWLPDYNDSMFSVTVFSSLIENETKREQWLNKLRKIQTCTWTGHCDNLSE